MKTPSTSRPVTGHALLSEGAAYDDNRERIHFNTTAGTGRGVCSCSAMSPNLPSGPKRKQWHREHKAEVLAEREFPQGAFNDPLAAYMREDTP